ncbi:bifunctional folylpolyglutamate synthase/dihydrofolate synthase [Desulforamulus aquiferis]|uniref:Dihydrofolate synthase/folylpolyglutamate synthase n=1 Tax=Desulforamulus aquiferis TaxID=1397668 RepID=A0AAW7Z946_9FIRM|nr:folylpolyglutamate synthase/dihydrofolate synthase family protein [Desulforamulus aquiferis]MDO7786263.1 bifunctional folylpolyglutamate synthase/dihydrofolate synthase [Desulforamulus aquiferis]
MIYEQSIDYLKGLTKFGINLGLGRIEELLRRLGNPHRRLKIVHIGGTNGKGSTTAMVASILGAAGYKVGRFTSPHLHSYTERFVINGVAIPEIKLVELISYIKPFLEEMVSDGYEHPTEFEVSTALALVYFEREATDYVVLEVGMGGAIDSTNIVTPLVSVITNVSLDHVDYLGGTVEEIARVKAGIIKQNTPVITAAEGSPLEIIREVAKEKDCPLVQIGKQATWVSDKSFLAGQQKFTVYGLKDTYHINLPLIGEHQQINAATAIAGVEVLLSLKGECLSPQTIEEGLSMVKWPGRLEILTHKPMTIIDGAHNLAGAIVLRRALEKYFSGRSIIMILGMLADKERAKVVAELAPLAKTIIVTRSNSPRAGDWQRVAQYAREYVKDVMVEECVEKAVELALNNAGSEELVCITGSLYMIAEARQFLISKDIA